MSKRAKRKIIKRKKNYRNDYIEIYLSIYKYIYRYIQVYIYMKRKNISIYEYMILCINP